MGGGASARVNGGHLGGPMGCIGPLVADVINVRRVIDGGHAVLSGPVFSISPFECLSW